MPRTAAVLLSLVILTAACTSAAGPPAVRSGAAFTPVSLSPAPLGRQDRLAFSEDPNSPLLTVYCAAQDKIVTLEGQVLEGHLSTAVAVAKMRLAQRIASAQVQNFERFHHPGIAALARRWYESFDRVVARLERGDPPIDALHPAIQGLGRIERRFTCELDA